MSDKLPEGLCGNRGDHEPHEHEDSTLGKFWCHADQDRREPHYFETRRTALKRTARRGH
jgi:hypothetical protein